MPRIWTYRWPANAGNDASFALDGATQFDGDGDGYDLWSQLLGPGEHYLIPMYPISDLYKQYLASRSREWLVKVEIDSVEYGASEIVDFTVENSILPADEFTIGTAIVSQLTLRLRTEDDIPANAQVIPYLAMTGSGGDTEWLPLGEFYIDRRELINDRLWQFTCLDKLVWAAVPYISQLTYPASMQDVWDEICSDIGYTYDESVVIDPSYTLPVAPTGFTCLQVLGYIAGCNAASVYIDKGGVLRFKRFGADDEVVIELPSSEYSRVKQLNPPKTYTKIVAYTDDEGSGYEAGSGDENHTLYIDNPLATQQIVNDLLAKLNGFTYVPVELDSPRGYPQMEVGDRYRFGKRADEYDMTWDGADVAWEDADWTWDGYEYGGGISLALNMSYTFRGGLKMVLEAPSVSEQESEFGIDGSITEAINRINRGAVKLGKPYYGLTVTREHGLMVERSDGKSKLTLNSDVMDWQVDGQSSLFYDALANRLKFRGDIQMLGGTISWDSVNSDPRTIDAEEAAHDALEIAQQIADGTYMGGTFISGSQIFSPNIFGGTIQIGSGNSIFKADSNGIYLGHATFGSAPFRVTPQGELTALSGTFGGTLSGADGTFTGALQGGTIAIGTGNNVFKADSNGIYLGNATYGSAPFRVSMSGALTASSGSIGGWGIDSGFLYGGTLLGGTIRGGEIETVAPGNYPRIAMSTSGNELIFAASATNYFRIYQIGPIFQQEIAYGSSTYYISKGSSGTTLGVNDTLILTNGSASIQITGNIITMTAPAGIFANGNPIG